VERVAKTTLTRLQKDQDAKEEKDSEREIRYIYKRIILLYLAG
jgi:hypothetical protein